MWSEVVEAGWEAAGGWRLGMEFGTGGSWEMAVREVWEELLSPSVLLSLVIIAGLFRLINILSRPEPPRLSVQPAASNAMAKVVGQMSLLQEAYVSPYLWGRNGHLQTIAYGLFNYKSLTRSSDKRVGLKLEDGSLVTFDIFQPMASHSEGDFTFALCPGIANHSQNEYIKRFFHHAQEAGFRCAVLNHTGCMKGIPLTTPRIFTYGSTAEYEAMVGRILEMYPSTRIIAVGFSMGGNIVSKWLGTREPALGWPVALGVSICQGYDAFASIQLMHEWRGLRRLINYVMCEKVKSVLRRHHETAVAPHVRSGLVEEGKLYTATSLYVLDELYSRRVHGLSHVDKYYQDASCIHHLPNIRVPMVYLNAEDDPIVPPRLYEPVQRLASQRPDTLHVLTKHGGHLGYMEGTSLAPRHISWLDRFVVDAANAAIAVYAKKSPNLSPSPSQESL